MKIIVAGRDRTSELGSHIRHSAEVRRQGKGRQVPSAISPEIGALVLLGSSSESDYLARFTRLLRYRDAVDTLDFDIPRKPGFGGKAMGRLKAILWKLLRYQHDRIAFRQNLINGIFTGAIEFEIAKRDQDIAELQRRVAALEAHAPHPGDGSPPKATP